MASGGSHIGIFKDVFSECVARVPVSLWGSGGWGWCSLDVAFTVATVRNRPHRPQPFAWGPYGRAYGKFCRGGNFWRFQTCRCFVSRGRRGTSWHLDVFCEVLKVGFAWQAQYFCDVFRRCVAVFVAGAALWTCPSPFFVQAQHFRRVMLRVFCKSHCRAASSGDKVQIPWQAWHFLTCAENWRKPRTKHRFEVANFHVLRKTRRKTSILKLQSVKIGGSLARNARLFAPTCFVSSLWFPVASQCLCGKPQNLFFSKVSKEVVMSFCVAGVALCDIPTCWWCVQNVKIGGSLVRKAGFTASTCLVSSRWFSWMLTRMLMV